eukprot:COSAG04_NODE_1014_length_8762_cov_31.342145_5_plen_222_part_00
MISLTEPQARPLTSVVLQESHGGAGAMASAELVPRGQRFAIYTLLSGEHLANYLTRFSIPSEPHSPHPTRCCCWPMALTALVTAWCRYIVPFLVQQYGFSEIERARLLTAFQPGYVLTCAPHPANRTAASSQQLLCGRRALVPPELALKLRWTCGRWAAARSRAAGWRSASARASSSASTTPSSPPCSSRSPPPAASAHGRSGAASSRSVWCRARSSSLRR